MTEPESTTPSAPSIVAYLNPMCPWSPGVVQVLKGHGFAFEVRDVIRDPQAYREMVSKSGQHSSPCVEVDGQMLADVGGDEVEAWMRQKGYIR
jgi:monothiol glutaredoxin